MASGSEPLVPLRTATALAVLAGVVMSLAFPPIGFGPYAIAAVALLTTALWRASLRRGIGLGFLAGIAFFAPLLWWMRVIGWDAWLLLSVGWAVWLALVGFGTALVTRLPVAPVWVAAVWVLDESLRSRMPFGGFPWGNIAFSQPDTAFVWYASQGGTPLATFTIALLGAGIVTMVLDYRAGRTWLAYAWLTALAAAVLVPSIATLPIDGDTQGGPPAAVIAAVQGGTPQLGMGAMDVRRAVLDNHVEQTLLLAEHVAAGEVPAPDFVLWPENSSDLDPFADQEAADAITSAARAIERPILVGAVTQAPADLDGVWNVGIVWDPETGPGDVYIKNHPVPFGEYIPFRDFLAQHVGRFDRIPQDFLAGDQPGNLTVGGVPVGNVICFEIAYGEVVDAVVDGGARVITVQTNNATYGGTAQPEQQLAISRVRAAEFGRSVVVASTTGISAVIAPDGTIVQELSQADVGSIVAEVPLRGDLTPASRIGHLVESALCALALVGLTWAAARSLVRRRRPIA